MKPDALSVATLQHNLRTIPDGALRHMLASITDKGSQLYARLHTEQRRRQGKPPMALVVGPL